MTKQVQRRRGTATQHTSFTGAEGEISVNTTNKSVHIHDGLTAGGIEAARADLTNVSDANLNAALSGNTVAALTITSATINGGTITGITDLAVADGGTGASTAATARTNLGAAAAASPVLTGQVSLDDGSAAAPSLTNTGDTNTGLFFPAEDTVGLGTGGTERLRVDASGNVTVGTTSTSIVYAIGGSMNLPAATTEARNIVIGMGRAGDGLAYIDFIGDATYSTFGLRLIRSATANGDSFINHRGTGSLILRTTDAGALTFQTATLERMRIDASGNVGIGTSSPAAKLDISSAGALTARVRNTASTATAGFDATNTTGSALFGVDAVGAFTYTGTAIPIRFSTNAAERMRIDASGNVGIGTGSPDARLRVAGAVNSLQARFSNVEGRGLAISTFSSVSTNDNGVIYNAGIFADAQHVWQCGGTERMRIDSSGNVGIGTSSPVQKLQVNVGSGGALFQNGSDPAAGVAHPYIKAPVATGFSSSPAYGFWYQLTGISNPASQNLGFVTDNIERMRIDASGNLGLGVTPSAWSASVAGLQLPTGAFYSYKSGTTSNFYMLTNAYFNGTNNVYVASNFATQYLQSAGQHVWYNAPSGTAGNAITFTQAMTLDASGNLGIGTSSPAARIFSKVADGNFGLGVSGATKAVRFIHDTTSSYIQGVDNTLSSSFQPLSIGGSVTILETSGTERMRIDASGNVGVGTTSPSGKLHVAGGRSYFAAASEQFTVALKYNATTTGVWLGSPGTDSFTVSTEAGTERMRIDASGNVLVGTTTSFIGGKSPKAVLYQTASQPVVTCYINSTAASNQITFNNPNGEVGQINTSSTTTTYGTSSDYRLKENVQPMQDALAKIAQLNPVTYTWKADGSDGQGFIAHELQAVVPDCVTGEKDAVDAEGNPQYQGVDTSFLVATLVKAIQELKAEVDSLRAQLNP